MSEQGIREVRGRFIRELKAAVADGTLEPHEAAVVLSSAMALMVAAVRDDGLRKQYVRDFVVGMPVAVEVARVHGDVEPIVDLVH